MSFQSSSLSSSKLKLISPSLTASEYKGGTWRLEDGCSNGSFGRQLLSSEPEVLGCDDFAVSGDLFEGCSFRGDSSLRLDSCRDFPLLGGEVLVAGSPDGCALLNKYDSNLLFDASVESPCKAIHSVCFPSFGCKPRVNLRVQSAKQREPSRKSLQHTLYPFRSRTNCKYRH